MIRIGLLLLSLFCNTHLSSYTSTTDDLIYKDGTVQITSEISTYETLTAGKPIHGSVIVTHDSNSPVNLKSFRIGNKPLKVEFIQSVPMSSFNKLEISIYHFELDGLKSGAQTLPPISVDVGGTSYQALPLSLEVGD